MPHALVLQSDFGYEDGAVSAMKGVAHSVSRLLPIYDNTHEIPVFDIWAGSYRLWQTVMYWPAETIFVSVVDPGVGSERRSIVAKTKDNQYIVTPDNGTLTHLSQKVGIVSVREIDETKHRLPNSGISHTFHGRDIYAYTGAKLASSIMLFEDVGPEVNLEDVELLPFQEATLSEEEITGMIDILDIRFGNLWTNISYELFMKLNIQYMDKLVVKIFHGSRLIYENNVSYGKSFGAIHVGEPVLYINSLHNLAIAINQGSFAKAYDIGTGTNWKIQIGKLASPE
ncbi:SAM hydrolase/SAM-dependent halogenase family protein [Saliterribacillus persicus]|uniref:DNA-directed RNA polymerase subunit delta n=1 Tax=Saliterribacillus persicus TaxID=930114 RepID=A0A368YAP4_9BACI|nr:S-adenosyl-l-methionine hydroxide adenosyltransferase family protein [Saliterribacillus persicus]RCW77195.1 hypothetical protein DFR57_10163 [Saliterribacillus persicus]